MHRWNEFRCTENRFGGDRQAATRSAAVRGQGPIRNMRLRAPVGQGFELLLYFISNPAVEIYKSKGGRFIMNKRGKALRFVETVRVRECTFAYLTR